MTGVEEAKTRYDTAVTHLGQLMTVSPMVPDVMPTQDLARALVDARTARSRYVRAQLDAEWKDHS